MDFKRTRNRSTPGARPGTLEAPEHARRSRGTVTVYTPDRLDETELDPSSVGADPSAVTWVNVWGLGDIDLLRAVGAAFDLHALALEDVVHVPQRPKVEDFDRNLFVVIQLLSEGGQREQLSLFVGENFVVTFQEREGDPFEPVRQRLRNARGRIRNRGADYLAYVLIDAAIDAYMPCLDGFEEGLELLEEELRSRTEAPVERIQRRRAELRELRRAVLPLREVTRSLAHGEWSQITADTQTFLRDCHDHAQEAVDQLDSCREIASGLMDAHLSTVSNEVNQTTRILTVIATIFMPLSFLAGLYGMNFDPDLPGNMPELSLPYAYPVALGVMGVLALGLYLYFVRKGWF